MFTKIIKYANRDLQNEVKNELKNSKCLDNAFYEIENRFKDSMVVDFNVGDNKYRFTFQYNNQFINGYADDLNRKMVLDSLDWDCSLVFKIQTNSCLFEGKKYQREDRIVFQKKTLIEKMSSFTYDDSINSFDINIVLLNGIIDNEVIIKNLLDKNNLINGIRDIFEIIKNSVDILNVELNIKSKKEVNSSNIIAYAGNLTKYVEYIEKKDNTSDKIYLQEGKFYIEKTTKELLDDNLIPYVKKIGEYHGKKER